MWISLIPREGFWLKLGDEEAKGQRLDEIASERRE
jgi:hypothetical protein